MRQRRQTWNARAIQCLCSFGICSITQAAEVKAIQVREDFERGSSRWTTTDPDPASGVWKIIEADRNGKPNHAFRVGGISEYKPPHRSPFSIALLENIIVSEFELSCRLQNTNNQAAGHRDLCLIWGYQDPAHFYYVHLGSKPDLHSCQVFIVNGADRIKITERESKGTSWTDDWHRAKVVRRVADGAIEIYFDNMKEPAMTARDKTFTWGRVGIGTFDDHGNFDDVILKGTVVEPAP